MTAVHQSSDNHLRPCRGCGFMMRGGTLCGDCREYGQPKGWRWQYDAANGKHVRVEITGV